MGANAGSFVAEEERAADSCLQRDYVSERTRLVQVGAEFCTRSGDFSLFSKLHLCHT
jgi:hypothetical protein